MIPALLIGGICGFLSGCGIGGGSLLLLYLTAVAGLDQISAQGINLLYFIPAASAALPSHFHHRKIEKAVLLPAILAGLAAAGLSAWAATGLNLRQLHRCFGYFLIVAGLAELFRKPPDTISVEDESGGKSDNPPESE